MLEGNILSFIRFLFHSNIIIFKDMGRISQKNIYGILYISFNKI